MIERYLFLAFISSIVLLSFSCESDPSSPQEEIIPELSVRGLLIANEGNFLQGNASLSYYDFEEGTIYNDVFKNVNGEPIGDVANSIYISDTLVYIVINNSDKIEVVSTHDFRRVRKINLPPGSSPRHIAISANGQLYVTNLYTDNVSVINPEDGSILLDIPVGVNPDGILIAHSFAYVANSGLGNGNTVSIIDLARNQVIKSIKVGDNPQWIELSSDDQVHVLCSGAYNDFFDPDDDSAGGVWIINPESKIVIDSLILDMGTHPSKLTLSADRKGYFIYAGHILEYDTHKLHVLNKAFIQANSGNLYHIKINDLSEEIYVCDAKDYVTAGELIIYDLQGNEKQRQTAGIIPGYVSYIVSKKE